MRRLMFCSMKGKVRGTWNTFVLNEILEFLITVILGITCNIPRPETIRILPSYSRTAYVAPYSKGCLNSQNLKLNKTEGIDNAACMQPTVSSSDSTSPHASSQDVVNSLKFNDGKSSIPNGFATGILLFTTLDPA